MRTSSCFNTQDVFNTKHCCFLQLGWPQGQREVNSEKLNATLINNGIINILNGLENINLSQTKTKKKICFFSYH